MLTPKKTASRSQKHASRAKRSSGARDPFREVLLKMLSAATQGGELSSLLSTFCRESRKFLNASAVGYWELQETERLLRPLEADGYFARAFKKSPLSLEDSVAKTAVRERRTLYINQLGPGKHNQKDFPNAQSLMVGPVRVSYLILRLSVFLLTT